MKKTVLEIYRELNGNGDIPELQQDCICFSPDQMIWFGEQVVKKLNIQLVSNSQKLYSRAEVETHIINVLEATGGDIQLIWKGTHAEFNGSDLKKWIRDNV